MSTTYHRDAPPVESSESPLLKIADVCRITRMSRATIYNRVAEGKFPKPIKLGPRSVAWVSSEVQEWIEQRMAARRER